MEYRKLPKGTDQERFSALGIGLGSMENTPDEEIEAIIRKAIDHGINFLICVPAVPGSMGPLAEPFGSGERKSSSSSILVPSIMRPVLMAGAGILRGSGIPSNGKWKL